MTAAAQDPTQVQHPTKVVAMVNCLILVPGPDRLTMDPA
jgi:hypothetical protein